MSKTEQLRDSVVLQMNDYKTHLQNLEMDAQVKRVDEKIEAFQHGVFQTLFTGVFSAGKSTTLNAVLHQKLLYVSINPATPVITRIVNGDNSDQVVITHRDGSPDEVTTLEKFQKEFHLDQADAAKFANIKYVTVERRLPLDTVAFIDSPGLGNTDIDDFVATDFAPKADAIVFMIHANVALKAEERAYIQKNYENRQMKNLFFVVNWYNILQQAEQPKLKEQVRFWLEPVFWDENGKFDEALYNKRVFFVDSYTAECYRTTGKLKMVKRGREVEEQLTEEDDLYSGIPAFEAALMEFLTSSDKDVASYADYMKYLAGMYEESVKAVAERKENMEKSIKELVAQEKILDENEKELRKTLDGIQTCIEDGLKSILTNAGGAYDDFVRSVENNWDEYFNSVDVPFGMREGRQLLWRKLCDTLRNFGGNPQTEADKLARDEEFQKLVKPVSDAVAKYLEMESGKMADNIAARSETAMNRMAKTLELYSVDLQELDGEGVDLKEILKILTNGKLNTDVIGKDANIAQLLISLLIFGNIDDAGRNILRGGEKWREYFMHTIVTELTEIILINIIAYITGIYIYYIIARAILGIFRLGREVRSLGNQILLDREHRARNELVVSLREQRDSSLTNIELKFRERFMKASRKMTRSITVEIDQQHKQLEKLIKKIEETDYDKQTEENRMDGELASLFEIFNELSLIVRKKKCTMDELKAMAVSSSFQNQ